MLAKSPEPNRVSCSTYTGTPLLNVRPEISLPSIFPISNVRWHGFWLTWGDDSFGVNAAAAAAEFEQRIVPVAVPVPMLAFVGSDRLTENISLWPTGGVAISGTTKFCGPVDPAGKVNVCCVCS